MHLAMNEGHGDKVQDLSMYGNHGKLHGFAFPPTVASGWNPGQTGIGLNFDGSNDYIDCGKQASLDITDEITISVCLKRSRVGTEILVSKLHSGAYELGVVANYIKGYIGGAVTDDITGTTAIDTNWHNLVFTYVQSSGRACLYLDGVVDKTEVLTATMGTSSNDLLIGCRIGNSLLFLGAIDQPRIHNRALSAKEVMDYYINPWQVYLDDDD